ncbi:MULTISPECIES: helix-turn-helix domain-containing protein [Sporosarcina]|uniref:helix-turn-helix domain-containing protein n=1 Tax=Sporosarcina TaxID=1569 RepID=UPI00058FC55C|nr:MULTISPECIES: XRE family transcriptional regulator [Sporosarcina]WJY28875.1 XRE family transcriptional regulator [Sporosarcina sp. 0.2-SM1T-5]
MQIGSKIKRLRLQNGLTQEELGERTDLTKGYISQLERDLNSPSIETLFSLLDVLGTSPKDFFDESKKTEPVVFSPEDQTTYANEEMGYKIRWLIPRSNENEMEPVYITFSSKGELKQFAPSLSETFIYILSGNVEIEIGPRVYRAKTGDAVYYSAEDQHRISNAHDGMSELLLVATESYL